MDLKKVIVTAGLTAAGACLGTFIYAKGSALLENGPSGLLSPVTPDKLKRSALVIGSVGLAGSLLFFGPREIFNRHLPASSQ